MREREREGGLDMCAREREREREGGLDMCERERGRTGHVRERERAAAALVDAGTLATRSSIELL